jgi:hypothetical protein
LVRTGSGFAVEASHVVSSVGRLSAVPPASEHSMIERPVGSSARVGKPVPLRVMVSPSV